MTSERVLFACVGRRLAQPCMHLATDARSIGDAELPATPLLGHERERPIGRPTSPPNGFRHLSPRVPESNGNPLISPDIRRFIRPSAALRMPCYSPLLVLDFAA